MQKKNDAVSSVNNPHYHNTHKLLAKYRDVVWSMGYSLGHLKNEFQMEYETDIDDFLDSIYFAGADLSGTRLERHARTIERSNKMIKLVQQSVQILRSKHKCGEAYYWILYYTYLSPQKLGDVEEIVEQLRPHIRDISRRTYFRKKNLAVEALSSVLWGYATRDNLEVLDEFFPEDIY